MIRQLVLENMQAPGDSLMFTCAVRDLHKQLPGQFITSIATRSPDVWTHNPYNKQVDRAEESGHLRIGYSTAIHNSNFRTAHFSTGFCQELSEKIGVRINLTDMRPDIHLTAAEKDPATRLVKEPYWLMMAGGKSDFTNKIWAPAYYQQTVDLLNKDMRIVQAGAAGHLHKPLTGVTNLVGKTTFRDFMCLVYHSQGVICPITSGMHLAAAFNKPCVTADTLITTSDGLRSVEQLIGIPFIALVNGKLHIAPKGFWFTGTKHVLRLSFKSGRQLDVTADHKLLADTGWKEAGTLTVGDTIILHNHRDFCGKVDPLSSDYARGYLTGNYVGDGTTSDRSAKVDWFDTAAISYKDDGLTLLNQAGWHLGRKYTAKVTDKHAGFYSTALYDFVVGKGCLSLGHKELVASAGTGSWSYLAGLVAGYIDADGTVTIAGTHGMSIRLNSVQHANLRTVQLVLSAFGILSKIYVSRKGGKRILRILGNKTKVSNCRTLYVLHIAGDSIERFHQFITLRNVKKQIRIDSIIKNRQRGPTVSRFTDTLAAVEAIGLRDVYDCEVPGPNAFDANSVYAHNCVCIAGGREGWWWEAYTRKTWEINVPNTPCPQDFVDHTYLHTIDKLPCCTHTGCWKNGVADKPDQSKNCKAVVKGPSGDLPKCLDMIKPQMVVEAVERYMHKIPIPLENVPTYLRPPLFTEPLQAVPKPMYIHPPQPKPKVFRAHSAKVNRGLRRPRPINSIIPLRFINGVRSGQ